MILSIIIVNYRSAQLILDCLNTLYAASADMPYEVLVVDNESGDDSRARITGAFPQVRWLDMKYNSGFARANNEGIRQSKGEAVLLLNGDTLPEAAAVTTCFHRLMASPDHVAAGVQLLNADGSPQISGMYVMKGGLNYLLPLPYLGGLVKKAGEWASVKKPHVQEAAGAVDVDWINGAFLLVKKSVLDKAGLLDEDFFLYAEEAEWCSRLHKQGRLCIYGDLRVIHLQGETANQAFDTNDKGYFGLFDRKGKQIMLSNFVRIRKQFGVGWFLVQLLFYVAVIPVFALGAFFSRLVKGPSARYSGRQVRQFTRNVGAILRLSPVIIRNKPYFYKVL